MARSPELTTAELRVLKALWELESGTVADVRAELSKRGQELAYTTVMTLLGRLASKGAVAVDRAREPFVYRAARRRELVLRDRLREFVREVFDGKAASLVLNLVEDESLTPAELRAIEQRITDAGGERDPRADRPAGAAHAEPGERAPTARRAGREPGRRERRS
jgi:predicted transcriptional regulator